MEYLISIGRLDEAAVKLAEIVNDVSLIEDPPLCVQELVTLNLLVMHCVCPSLQDKFVSKEGKSKNQLWQELCVLISKNPGKVGYTYNDAHFTSIF